MTDVLSKEQRRKNMQHIRSKDTKIEMLLRRELWKRGYRYRKNYIKLPGRPDIVFTKYKIAVFCDGEFFHGADWEVNKEKILRGDNGQFWVEKITRNMERDRAIDAALSEMGWTVLRFWGKEISSDTYNCIMTIEKAIAKRFE